MRIPNIKKIFTILVISFIPQFFITIKAVDFDVADVQIDVTDIKYDYNIENRNGVWLCEGSFSFNLTTNAELIFDIYWYHNKTGARYHIYPDEYTPNVPFSFNIPQGFKYTDSIEIRYKDGDKLISPMEHFRGIDYVNDEDRQLLLSSVNTIPQEQDVSWEISNQILRIIISTDKQPSYLLISDLTSKLILNQVLSDYENFIDLRSLQPGIYIFNIIYKDNSIIEKIRL